MYPSTIILIVVILWLLVLTLVLCWFLRRISKVLKDTEGNTLLKVLEKIYKKEQDNEKDIKGLDAKLSEVIEGDFAHIQRVGLVRFNPFNETGGDHSFSLALMDGKNNGLVLTALHTRERTRLYLKPVKSLKSEYELSKEEQKALDKAVKGK